MTAAVVLVPGLGLDARSWDGVRRRLAAPGRVVGLPSMGHRAGRTADLHVERQAVRLVAALPAEGRVVLVGHSASCPVVVETARRCPAVVGLVLVGPVTHPGGRTWPRVLAEWLRTAIHEQPWEAAVLAPQYGRTGIRSILRGMDRARRSRTDVGLAAAAARTIVVRGEHDRIAPAAWCAALAGSVPGEVVTVAGAAHMVPLTHPGAVAAAADRLCATGVRTP